MSQKDIGKAKGLERKNISVEGWELSDFQIEDFKKALRMVKFRETSKSRKKKCAKCG